MKYSHYSKLHNCSRWTPINFFSFHIVEWTAVCFCSGVFLFWLLSVTPFLAYNPHNALGALRFRSCAVSGADWNPESGFDKWSVYCGKGNAFYFNSKSLFHRMATPLCSKGAVALPGLLRVFWGRFRYWLLVAEVHRLRFGASRLRSIRHADCSLLHFTEEKSLRSELKPG